MAARRVHGPLGFRIIGGFKLVGCLLLFGLGIGVLNLAGKDVGAWLTWAITTLRLDPSNQYIQQAVAWGAGVSPDQLKEIGFGTFFYASLYLVESLGLIFERSWAAYLTIIATASLIPVEGYEVVHKVNTIKILVLLVNVGVVVYLIWKLHQERASRKANADSEQAETGSSPQDQ